MADIASAEVTTPLSLLGCGVTTELAQQPDVSANFTGRIRLFGSAANAPVFKWEMDSRGLVAAWALSDGGVGATVISGAAATWPRWLRIEESGGQVLFRTATATTFTTVQSVPHGERLDSMTLQVQVGYPLQAGGDRATLRIDNVNLGP